MNIRSLLIVFCVVVCLSVSLTTPASAKCEDIKNEIRNVEMNIKEMDMVKAELHGELNQTHDPSQKHPIELQIEEINEKQAGLDEKLGELHIQLSACEQESDKGIHPLIIAAIIGAAGAVLAALINLLKRR